MLRGGAKQKGKKRLIVKRKMKKQSRSRSLKSLDCSRPNMKKLCKIKSKSSIILHRVVPDLKIWPPDQDLVSPPDSGYFCFKSKVKLKVEVLKCIYSNMHEKNQFCAM